MIQPKTGSAKTVGRRAFLGGAAGLAGVAAASGARPALSQDKGTIRVGAPLPLTGIFSGDGEEFRRGLVMAVEEINASGGLVGYQVETVVDDAQDSFVEQMQASFERLLRKEKVDAVLAGYLIGSPVELDMVAESGVPYLSQQAQIKVSDMVASDLKKYRMVFQTCPPGTYYGYGLVDFLKSVPEDWLAQGKTVAVIGGDNGYSEQIHVATRAGLKEAGWQETHFEVVPYGIPDWTPTLTKIRDNPPSVIAMNDGIVGDDSLFIKQFSDLPTKSLIYQVFTPSTPEYFDVVGDLADGVIWSTVIGILPDEIGNDFRTRYRARWDGDEPSFGAAGPMYDQVHMWAQAVRMAGDPKDKDAVCEALTAIIYRGVAGGYHVKPDNLTVPSYPTEVKDPSLALPHTFYQIEGREHRCVWPAPYSVSALRKPAWMA
jgi:branched-chain amino acid transport system substrate-binding protein